MTIIDSLKDRLKQVLEYLDEIPRMPRPLALNEVRTVERLRGQLEVGFKALALDLVTELSAEDHKQWAEEERFSGNDLMDEDPRTSRN